MFYENMLYTIIATIIIRNEIIISHEWSLIRTDASVLPISGYAVVNV